MSVEPNSGFCPEGTEPWLPVAGDHGEVNVAAQARDSRSMLSLTRRLLALRQKLPTLHAGGYDLLGEDVPEDCLAYVRRHQEESCLVALNSSGEERELRLPDKDKGRILVSTLLDREGATSLKGKPWMVPGTVRKRDRPDGPCPCRPDSSPYCREVGELDRVKPASWAEGIEETFPNLDFQFVPGAGHFVSFEALEETIAAIRTALSMAR